MQKKKKVSKTLRRTVIGILSGSLTGLLLFAISQIPGFTSSYLEQIERVFYDVFFKLEHVYTLDNMLESDTTSIKTDSTLESRIVIVDIDERALEKFGTYNTWPRTQHAKVVDYLKYGGASSITFDILFKTADFGEKDAQKAFEILQKLKPNEDLNHYYPLLKKSYNYDSVLVQSVKNAGNVIVCATMNPRNNYEHKTQWEPLSTNEWQKTIGIQGTLDSSQIPNQAAAVWDLLDNVFPELANATNYLGLVNVIPDDDGVHRRVPLFHGFPNPEITANAHVKYYSLITIQTVSLLFGLNPADIIVKPGEYVNLGKPLGIKKDSSGYISTTYPNLTWAMIRELLRKKQEVINLSSEFQEKKTLEISHQIILNKDDEGTISADIHDAQTLTQAMIYAIVNVQNFDSLATLAKTSPQRLDDNITLSWNADEEMLQVVDLEEETVTLTNFAIEVLRENKDVIASLSNKQQLYLASNLDLRWDNSQNKLVSSFIILNPKVLEDLLNHKIEDITAIQNGSIKRFGNEIKIPVNENLQMQINYIGQYNTDRNKRAFKQISYYDVAEQRIDAGGFQGKTFILGSTAPALFDLVSAPHEAEFPGVLVHANILENILNDNFLTILKDHQQLWIILALGLICAILSSILPPFIGIFATLFLGIGYMLIGMNYFDDGLYIGLARQELTIFLTFVVIMLIRYFYEQKDKRFLHDTFKQYISPELIEIMVENDEMPELGGENRYCTAFFTDIAGFSSFSEAIGAPDKLVLLLNEYLGEMTDVLMINRGTLDKYIGDAIVGIFGAPVTLENHASLACNVAIKMQQKLAILREKWVQEGDKWPKLVHKMQMRIGINSGDMVVGNMGSEVRKNYTMMGDTVNLAARLESASKQYGVYIQIADSTLKELPANFVLSRELDALVVMGKTEPVICHEILGFYEEATPSLQKLVEIWNEAKKAYVAMQWDKAIDLFNQCMDLEPHHPDRYPGSKTTPSHVFIKRCLAYKVNPPVAPGDTWDGIYVATSK